MERGMGLLDEVIGGLGGNNGASPIQSVLMNLLSNRNTAPVQSGQTGGLGGLLSIFEGAGLGRLVQSWIGQGANQPVTPDQLKSVFGEDRVRQMANQSGMAPESFLQQLSHHLPNVVDKHTPNGTVPDEGTLSV
jgi:uncharacterized protein YidB (DUF937 family)